METAENKRFVYEFGKFALDPQERVLLADGKPVHLADKVFDTLLFLIQHNGRLLTKDEMMTSIWEESFVEEGNLAKNISRLRKILNADGTHLIETLPKHGYRFLADVKKIDGETSLLVRRNLRVKITHTVEDESEPQVIEGESSDLQLEVSDFRLSDGKKYVPQSAIRNPRSKVILLAALSVLLISVLGFYFWKREKPVLNIENGAIRLTDNPKDDNYPAWTKDGRIRFLRIGSDRQPESLIMNADGTNQTEVKDFNSLDYGFWSPDGTKVIFVKRGDKTAFYLADANGEHEIALPFYAGNFDWSPDSQKIVYQKMVNVEDADIFVYSLETGKSENVTNNPAFDADPNFAPDGKQIVFASLRDGNAEIYLMQSDGGDVRRLTNHPAWDSHPVFSPDGKQIVYQAEVENKSGELRVFDTESKQTRVILKTENADLAPVFSPDGEWIAFQNRIESNTEICLIKRDGSNLKNLTQNAARDGSPTFSPDGRQIAFASNRDGNYAAFQLYVMDSDGSNPHRIYSSKAISGSPAWSSDGKQIVFANDKEDGAIGNFEIFRIELETAESEKRLTFRRRADTQPVFSPDGKLIAFSSNTDGNAEVYLMNADGTGFLRVTRNQAEDVTPQFSKDGRIIFSSNRNGKFALYEINLAE